MVDYLLSIGVYNLDAVDKFSWTAISCASSAGHLEICHKLMKQGADPTLSNDQKTTPLHYLVRYWPPEGDHFDYEGLLTMVMESGVHVDSLTERKETVKTNRR